MRKLMLGAVLLAAMLPVTTVYAAGEGKAKANYMANKAGKAAKKNAEDAIAEGVANGLSVQDAMAEIIQADPNNAAVAVAAAIKADPTNAGAITKFALSKAPSQSAAITRAALDAVKTPEARRVVAAAASESGVPVSVINAQLKDVTTDNGSYEVFAVNNASNTSTVSKVTPSQNDNVAGNTNTSNYSGNTNTGSSQTAASGGGGVCDPKKASCS